jgi:hypothetical protein
MNLNNNIKFHKCTCWSTNDIRNHDLLYWVNNCHIDNKNLILMRKDLIYYLGLRFIAYYTYTNK